MSLPEHFRGRAAYVNQSRYLILKRAKPPCHLDTSPNPVCCRRQNHSCCAFCYCLENLHLLKILKRRGTDVKLSLCFVRQIRRLDSAINFSRNTDSEKKKGHISKRNCLKQRPRHMPWSLVYHMCMEFPVLLAV